MHSVRVDLFGSMRLAADGKPITGVNTGRLQSLLAWLVLHEGPQLREHLAAVLWPDSNAAQARTNLRQLLHNLRRVLPTDGCPLASDAQTVEWRRSPENPADIYEFDDALTAAAAAERRRDADGEEVALARAAALCHDDLLRDLYDDWIAPLREDYRQRTANALTRLAVLLEQRGEAAAAIRYAERLAVHEPLREAHHQLLMRLHLANTDPASAIRTYHRCLRVLRRELGVDPGPETRELFNRALRSDPPKPAAAPPELSTTPGMRMVGRTAEWQKLLGCRRNAEGRGTPQLAAILGEPGIGKSRLAEELYLWWQGQSGSVARTRCYAAQGHLGFAPVAEWLRSPALRAVRPKLALTQLAQLARVLPEVLADNPSIARPQSLGESWERHHFYEALNAAIAAAPKPLLLLADDLQWCDTDTFDWLRVLLRPGLADGVLLVTTVRSEETGRDHPLVPWIAELKQFDAAVEIPLAPMDIEETRVLVAQVAGRPADDAEVASLYSATGGNPLFVVESVRAGDLAAPRIQAVIGARLAQLSRPARELCEFAATAGRAFTFDLLAQASDWDENSVSGALDELWQRNLIQERGGAGEYDFSHDRIREVAYASLSPVRRRFLHRRLARATEEVYGKETAAVQAPLAAHYDAAGMVAVAIERYRAAATVAQGRFAAAEATDLLRRALALCGQLPQTPQRDEQELDLLTTLGPALVSTLGFAMPEVGERYDRALDLCTKLGTADRVLSVLSGAWVFHVVRAQLETSRGLAQRFLEEARRSDDPAVALAGSFPLASSLFHLGEIRASRELIAQVFGAAAGGSPPALRLFAGPDIGISSGSYLAHIYWLQGESDRALTQSAEMVDRAAENRLPFRSAIALGYAALLYVFHGDSSTALLKAEQAAALCDKYGFAYYLSMAEIAAGWAVARGGDPPGGLARLRAGIEAFRTTGAELRLPFYYALLAEVLALNGQTGEALANISTAFAFQSKNGELWASPELHRIHGDILLASGNRIEAEASFRRAVEAALEMETAGFAARANVRLRSHAERSMSAGQNGGRTPGVTHSA